MVIFLRGNPILLIEWNIDKLSNTYIIRNTVKFHDAVRNRGSDTYPWPSVEEFVKHYE